ncbi:MAG: acyltransferase [Gammaproteobacteria bacterium]
MNRVAFLDYLRALAVLPVMLTHDRVVLAPGGFLGVDVFFVLSGFFITLLLGRDMPFVANYASFLVRRMFRILPLYYLSLVAYLLLMRYLDGTPFASMAGVADAFLMLSIPQVEGYRAGYFWTLQVEFWFYLAFPPLFLAMPGRAARAVGLLAIAAASFYCAAHPAVIGQLRAALPVAVVQLIEHASEFMIGALLALWSTHKRSTKAWQSWALLVLGLGGLAVFYTNILDLDLFGPRQYLWRFLVAAATGLVVAAWCGGHFNRVVLPGLGYLGLISYSLYLLHLPMMEFMSNVEAPGRALGEVAPWLMINRGLTSGSVLHYIVICAVFATVTYLLIEKPFIRVGRRLSRRIETRAAPVGVGGALLAGDRRVLP